MLTHHTYARIYGRDTPRSRDEGPAERNINFPLFGKLYMRGRQKRCAVRCGGAVWEQEGVRGIARTLRLRGFECAQ